MAERKTNRVALPVGPTSEPTNATERRLIQRVNTLETATGLGDAMGQSADDLVIDVGGGDTIVNNYTTVTGGGGGGYTTNVIVGGTGVVNNPTMPTTLGVVYDRAYGSTLVSQLTTDGNALEGVYSSNRDEFRPVNNLSMVYNTGVSGTSHIGEIIDWPSTDYYLTTAFTTSNGNTGNRDFIPFQLSTGEVGYAWSGAATISFYIATGPTTVTQFAVGTLASGTHYHKPLGSDSSGNVYFMRVNTNERCWVEKIDVGSMHAAWLSAGTTQSPNGFILSTSSFFNAGIPDYTDACYMTEQWAGNLTGRDYAHIYNITRRQIVRVHLATSATSVMTTISVSNAPGTASKTFQHIASPEWGNSTTDQYLGWWWFGTEYRLVKFGSWGYADITAIGTGPPSNSAIHTNIVPQSDTATMFFGGAPTHVSWYDSNLGGVQYVDLSTII